MDIWDGHCHIVGYSGTPEERVAKLVALADRMGVERMCIFMGTSLQHEPNAEQLRTANNEILSGIKAWPERVFGYVYLNPQFLQASLAELNRCVGNGPMVGIKLWVAQHCDTPEVDTIVKRAIELKAPIFQHTWRKATGNLSGESTAEELARLAARHPKANFICGHTSGDWEQGIRAIRDQENIYAELGGVDPSSGFTEMAVRELGAHRVIFGSDVPLRSYSSQLAKVYGARIADQEKAMILGDNLKRILRPILDTKGVTVS